MTTTTKDNKMNELQRVADTAAGIVFNQVATTGDTNIQECIAMAFSKCWSVENNKENRKIVLDLMCE